MQCNCIRTGETFEVTDHERKFLETLSPVFDGKKFEIPLPDLCPQERLMQRLIWRPELHLCKRKSDKSGDTILSFLPEEAPCVVYSSDEWWEDDWDPFAYGRDFDFERPFYEQFKELLQVTPLPSVSVGGEMINSDYLNSASWCKNCYLLAGANHNEDCLYGNYVNNCTDCMDCNFIDHCELCYECIDCVHCYNVRYSQQSSNCKDSQFLFACRGCQDCFGCVNIVNKQYMFLNEQLTKDEYMKRLEGLQLHKRSRVQEAREFFNAHRLKYPHKYMIGEMNENVTGNAVIRSRDCQHCFDVSDSEDCHYCGWFHQSKTCMDCYAWGFSAEECYRNMEVGGGSSRILFSVLIYICSNILYSVHMRSSKHAFGCVSLKNAEYCVFNKQYTKEEYERLVARIIEHMQQTGEWGQFFPYDLCPMAYNQSIAHDLLPLSESEAKDLGARWGEDQIPEAPADTPTLPDAIDDCSEDLCDHVLRCAETGKAYKIIPQEFAFYTRNNIPVPDIAFYNRHLRRLHRRNPRTLWQRTCDKCGIEIMTSYAPERPEIVYCHDCYLAALV